MRVVFFGTYNRRVHPRVRVLQEGFVEHGDEVLECNVPLEVETAARVKMLKQPWRAPMLAGHVSRAWLRLSKSARAQRHVDAVVIGYMGHFDIHLARRLWKRPPVVLDHLISARDTAVDRGVSAGWLLRLLGRIDAAALRRAHIPIVDTRQHLELLPAEKRGSAVVVPVGAPSEWFHNPEQREGELSVMFYGLYTPLQGAPVIGEAIRILADRGTPIRFTMLGHGQDLTQTRAAAGNAQGVNWVKWVEPEKLPALVASHDVCLGIFADVPKAHRVVPNKVFQGAAAGCAIVTGETEAQRAAFEGAATFVPPADARALAETLLEFAEDRARLSAMKVAAFQRMRERFTPGKVVAPLRERLLTAYFTRRGTNG